MAPNTDAHESFFVTFIDLLFAYVLPFHLQARLNAAWHRDHKIVQSFRLYLWPCLFDIFRKNSQEPSISLHPVFPIALRSGLLLATSILCFWRCAFFDCTAEQRTLSGMITAYTQSCQRNRGTTERGKHLLTLDSIQEATARTEIKLANISDCAPNHNASPASMTWKSLELMWWFHQHEHW